MVQAGEDVTFIDPWPAHVEHMRKHGLRVTHAMKEPEFTVPVRALHVTDAQQLAKEKPVDIAFVCMKSYDTAWATMLIRQYLAPAGYVVSLQNCMNEETIAGVVGWHARPREETPVLGEPRGPATELRMTPEQTIAAVEPGGLRHVRTVEVSPYHYGAVFEQM